MILVKIELTNTSQPIVVRAKNTYTKGPLFCVYDGHTVQKFPVASIFRITEEYEPARV